MELIYRYISAAVTALLALFAPISPLILCVVVFIGVDFVSGVWASSHRAREEGERWYFESEKAWRTLYKLGFTLIAIGMAWLIEFFMIDFIDIHLSRLFAGFVCGVELWSFLENASQLSDAPYFEWMRQYVRRRIDKKIEQC